MPNDPRRWGLRILHHLCALTLGMLTALVVALSFSLQDRSRSSVGKPCAPAPTGRSASFGEEAQVDSPRLAGLVMRPQSRCGTRSAAPGGGATGVPPCETGAAEIRRRRNGDASGLHSCASGEEGKRTRYPDHTGGLDAALAPEVQIISLLQSCLVAVRNTFRSGILGPQKRFRKR
jgi:hypothetical protein